MRTTTEILLGRITAIRNGVYPCHGRLVNVVKAQSEALSLGDAEPSATPGLPQRDSSDPRWRKR